MVIFHSAYLKITNLSLNDIKILIIEVDMYENKNNLSHVECRLLLQHLDEYFSLQSFYRSQNSIDHFTYRYHDFAGRNTHKNGLVLNRQFSSNLHRLNNKKFTSNKAENRRK